MMCANVAGSGSSPADYAPLRVGGPDCWLLGTLPWAQGIPSWEHILLAYSVDANQVIRMIGATYGRNVLITKNTAGM